MSVVPTEEVPKTDFSPLQLRVLEAYQILPSLTDKQKVVAFLMEGRKNVPMRKILFELDTIELTLHREPTDWTVLYDEYKRLSIDTAPILSLRRALSQPTSVRCREKNVFLMKTIKLMARSCYLCKRDFLGSVEGLSLHHLQPDTKKGHPSVMLRCNMTTFLAECRKCEVVHHGCNPSDGRHTGLKAKQKEASKKRRMSQRASQV